MDAPCTIALVVNVAWFGLAFHLFALRSRRAVKMLTPASSRDETSREALVASLRFLGGMNLGMAVLSAAQLAERWHAAPSGVARWPLWPLLLCLLGVSLRGLTAICTRQRPLDALFLPISVLLMTRIALQAIWWQLRDGGPRWKDRKLLQ